MWRRIRSNRESSLCNHREMSLVGSSVKIIPEDADGIPIGVESTESLDEQDNMSHQEMATAYQEYDAHPPPTPPGAAEALFMSGLPTHNISAAALAEQIHLRHRPLSLAGTSIATDDFASATDALHSSMLVEHDSCDGDNNNHYDHDDAPFGNDALIHSREALIIEEDVNMAAKTTTATKTTPTVKKTEAMHVDPAEKIYGTAKGE